MIRQARQEMSEAEESPCLTHSMISIESVDEDMLDHPIKVKFNNQLQNMNWILY